MSAALKQPMTLEAFLEWESRQEARYEFDGFEPVAMTGASAAHAAIQFNLSGVSFNRLRGHRCRGFGEGLKIQVAGRVRYPDAFIVCTPIPPGSTLVHDPVVVFEILSPSTADTDRFEKNWEYRATPSIQHYVMLEQSRAAATVFSRAGEDWVGHLVASDGEIGLPELGISLPMTELYEGVAIAPRSVGDIGDV